MKNRENRNEEEIVIPLGYKIEDFLDTDDSDFDEPPIMIKEVNLRYERDDGTTASDRQSQDGT